MLSVKDRFSNKVSIDINGCWIWTGAIRQQGYGEFGWNKKPIDAHRASWKIFKGEIPEGKYVLHACDIKRCVNPEHLFIGTQKDNIQDMIRKGRRGKLGMPGESNPRAKLTEKIVKEIRDKISTGVNKYATLAREYGVSAANISDIANYKIWRNNNAV